jgi:predicted GIY-YIG superfamily endonuclease
MAQALLFPDPKPLDQRLGRKFFRQAPQRPGVYLMKNAAGQVVYVGKAKNLKQRLNNYRLANPDRMPRRHLRMVREVARIELQFCANEAAALRREARLLRALRPRFNRAGVWPGKPRFIVWRAESGRLELGVAEVPALGWHRFGPLNSSASHLHLAFARLLWLAIHRQRPVSDLPAGWALSRLPAMVSLPGGDDLDDLTAALNCFFWEDPGYLLAWLGVRLAGRTNAFERAMIASDVEVLQNFAEKPKVKEAVHGQLALL